MIILVNIPWNVKRRLNWEWRQLTTRVWRWRGRFCRSCLTDGIDRSWSFSHQIILYSHCYLYILSNQLIKSIIKMKFTLFAVAATLSAVSAFTSVSLILKSQQQPGIVLFRFHVCLNRKRIPIQVNYQQVKSNSHMF